MGWNDRLDGGGGGLERKAESRWLRDKSPAISVGD